MWPTVRYARLFIIVQAQTGPNKVSVIRNSGVSGSFNVLKSMNSKIHSGHSKLSVISQVSTVEGCPLSRVPLYGLIAHDITG